MMILLTKARAAIPTPAQAEAGNYRKRPVAWQGLTLKVENEAGSVRRGKDLDGKEWATKMPYAYGYVARSEGVDGDEVDVYLGPDLDGAGTVYVVHQRKKGALDAVEWKGYDEDKVMLGFPDEDAARTAYLKCYDDPRFLGPITAMPVPEFVSKVKATKERPAMIKCIVLLSKSHISAYTKTDGTFVAAHEDKRKAASRDASGRANVSSMDDAKNVAGKQATNPAGDVEQGSAKKEAVAAFNSWLSAAKTVYKAGVAEGVGAIADVSSLDDNSLPVGGRASAILAYLKASGWRVTKGDSAFGIDTEDSHYILASKELGKADDGTGDLEPYYADDIEIRIANHGNTTISRRSGPVINLAPGEDTFSEAVRMLDSVRVSDTEEIEGGRYYSRDDLTFEQSASARPDEKKGLAKSLPKMILFAKAHVGPYLRNGKMVNLAGYQGRNAAARAMAGQAALFSDDEAPRPKRKKASPERFDHTKTGDLFADADTAHAEGDKWVMPIKDAIAEHAELVAALKSPGRSDDQREVKEQAGELGRMKSTVEQGGAEAALRAFWDEKGVPKDQQDALIAAVAEKSAPGAQVGPFRVPDRPWLIFDQKNKSANKQKGLTSALSGSKIETSGAVPGTARRESGAQEKKMSIPEIKPITYALPAGTTGPLADKTLTGGRSASRVLDGKPVEVVIFPTEENGFDAGKYGPEIVVKTPGRPDLIAAVADQRAAKAAAFEAAIPGITEILPLSRKVGNDRARYTEQFNRMMEDEGNDGARPPKLADEAREKLLEEKLAANPRAAQYLRALSFEDASNYMKAAAGSKAKAMLLAGEPTDKAQAEMDDWTGEKAKAAEAAASGARLRSIMTRENGWDVVENMPEFFSPEWKALQGKGYKMYMLGRDGVPVENALNGTIMAKPL